jgi:hypothetical protein
MKKHFTPRKKKISGPIIVGAVKNVRIDSNTIIQCSTSISDEDAKERFYDRHKTAIRPEVIAMYPMTKRECYKEVPMGSVEHLAQIIDDELLPDLE